MTGLRTEIQALRNKREGFIANLGQGVAELRSDVDVLKEGFRDDRSAMAGIMKADLRSFLTEIGEYVAKLKDDVADMQEDSREEHAGMSRKLRHDLGMFTSGLKANVAELKEGFRDDRSEMTGKMKADLLGFLTEIGEYVVELKDDVADMQGGFREEHAEMSRNAKAERELFFSEVKNSVAVLKEEISDLLEGIAEDLGGARRAWSGSSLADGRSKMPKTKAAVQNNLRKEPEKRVAELFPDDLTRIKGIGPGRSKLLNEAGISTFAQLAGRTPGKLEQIVGISAKKADMEEWIRRAKEYSR
jgi:predicted flap endonuclease-1-like 5' DNA nuclease